MNYCRIHGDYEGDGCSYCREVVEREAVDRRAMIERLDDIEGSQRKFQAAQIEAIKNPGDYDCEHCRFRTLKYGAKKCPKCLGQVSPDYWKMVDEAEKTARENEKLRQIEKQKRLAIEQEAQRINNEKKYILLASGKKQFWRLYAAGFFLTILAGYFLFRYYPATITSFFIVYGCAGEFHRQSISAGFSDAIESYNKPVRGFVYLLLYVFIISLLLTPVIWVGLDATGINDALKEWR